MEFKEEFTGGRVENEQTRSLSEDIKEIIKRPDVNRALEHDPMVVEGEGGPILFARDIKRAIKYLRRSGLVDVAGKLQNAALRIFLPNKKTGLVEEQFMEGIEAAGR